MRRCAVQHYILWHFTAYAGDIGDAAAFGHQFGHWQFADGGADPGVPGAAGRPIGREHPVAVHHHIDTVIHGTLLPGHIEL